MPIRQTLTSGQVPVHIFTDDVDDLSRKQLANVATLPFIFKHVAAMPDVHAGLGAVIGSVIPSRGAVIPAAVGVDIGCGMTACSLDLKASELGDNGEPIRAMIEKQIPHGRTHQGGADDRGAWGTVPDPLLAWWRENGLETKLPRVLARHPKLLKKRVNTVRHLATLGTGNHFIELCLDQKQDVWLMLHSGSRGIGNRIGTYFIDLARQALGKRLDQLPDPNLASLSEQTQPFDDYVQCVQWAQVFARANRAFMLEAARSAIGRALNRPVQARQQAIDCHHNYLQQERHFGSRVWVTRKGAIRAQKGELGIIPGSMGARSFIVRGRGNRNSFNSCAHGAGRSMSRREALRRFGVDDLARQTQGVACRKDKMVVDEIPSAYKDIDQVMANQTDLVEVVQVLKQVVCVKG